MTKSTRFVKEKLKKIQDFKYREMLQERIYRNLMEENTYDPRYWNIWECIYLISTTYEKPLNLPFHILKIKPFEIYQLISATKLKLNSEIYFWDICSVAMGVDPLSSNLIKEYLISIYIWQLLQILEIQIFRKLNFEIIRSIDLRDYTPILEQKYLEEWKSGYRNLKDLEIGKSVSLSLSLLDD